MRSTSLALVLFLSLLSLSACDSPAGPPDMSPDLELQDALSIPVHQPPSSMGTASPMGLMAADAEPIAYAALRVDRIYHPDPQGPFPDPLEALLDATWYYQSDGSADFSAAGSVITGTLSGWPESGDPFHFADHEAIDSDLVAWWSIHSLNPPSGWFYGYDDMTQVAHAPSATSVASITDASIYTYEDWSIGPVAEGEIVLFRLMHAVEEPTACAGFDALRQHVNDLASAGALNRGRATALLGHVDSAEAACLAGRQNLMCARLNAFHTQVSAFRGPVLTAEQADPAIALAQSLLDQKCTG